jgi:hypothetical protein
MLIVSFTSSLQADYTEYYMSLNQSLSAHDRSAASLRHFIFRVNQLPPFVSAECDFSQYDGMLGRNIANLSLGTLETNTPALGSPSMEDRNTQQAVPNLSLTFDEVEGVCPSCSKRYLHPPNYDKHVSQHVRARLVEEQSRVKSLPPTGLDSLFTSSYKFSALIGDLDHKRMLYFTFRSGSHPTVLMLIKNETQGKYLMKFRPDLMPPPSSGEPHWHELGTIFEFHYATDPDFACSYILYVMPLRLSDRALTTDAELGL